MSWSLKRFSCLFPIISHLSKSKEHFLEPVLSVWQLTSDNHTSIQLPDNINSIKHKFLKKIFHPSMKLREKKRGAHLKILLVQAFVLTIDFHSFFFALNAFQPFRWYPGSWFFMGPYILTQLEGIVCFSSFYGQCLVVPAWTNLSPWSIYLWDTQEAEILFALIFWHN